MNAAQVIDLKRVKIVVKWEYDESPDTSHMGSHSDNYVEGAIKRFEYTSNRELNYFIPEITEQEHFDSLRKMMKGSRHEYSVKRARELAREYVMQNYQRMEALNNGYWGYMGCIVKLYLDNRVIGSDSLWGIESDMDSSEHKAIEDELIHSAYHSATKYLASLGSTLTLPALDEIEVEFKD